MSVGGIKSIKEDITLKFDNPRSTKKETKGLIKAIYGANGVGKTGIVLAADFYARLAKNETSLDDSPTVSILTRLINKNRKSLSIQMTYRIRRKSDEPDKFLSHSLKIGYDEFGSLRIFEEEIFGLSKKEESDILAGQRNGEFIGKPDFVSFANQSKVDFTKHTLSGSLLMDLFAKKAIEKDPVPSLMTLAQAFLCASNISVFFGETSDSHESFAVQKMMELLMDRNKKNEQQRLGILQRWMTNRQRKGMTKSFHRDCFDIIEKTEKKTFESSLGKLAAFLKIMKPGLIRVEPSYKEDVDTLVVNLTYGYQSGFRVDYEFESTGIKKLTRLFYAFLAAARGSIVFIDEIDSDIHDVYITVLIEYFLFSSDAQIVMTTHNVEIMDPLNKTGNSIDFLTEGNGIVPWSRGARKNPKGPYLGGFILGIPFNISEYQFAEIFGDEQKDE